MIKIYANIDKGTSFNAPQYLKVLAELQLKKNFIFNFTNKGVPYEDFDNPNSILFYRDHADLSGLSIEIHNIISLDKVSDITKAFAIWGKERYNFREMRYFLWSDNFAEPSADVKKEKITIGLFNGNIIYGPVPIGRTIQHELRKNYRYIGEGYYHVVVDIDSTRIKILSVERDPSTLTPDEIELVFRSMIDLVKLYIQKERDEEELHKILTKDFKTDGVKPIKKKTFKTAIPE